VLPLSPPSAAALKLHLERENDVVVIRGKGKRERYALLGGYAQAALKKWLPVRTRLCEKFGWKTSALLLQLGPGRPTGRLDVRSVKRIIVAVAKNRGLDPAKWHPLLFRHGFGTNSHNRGMPLQAISSLLGTRSFRPRRSTRGCPWNV
jgi:integrase/recombinase XerC